MSIKVMRKLIKVVRKWRQRKKKKKKKTRRLVATIQIRKKWFPSMILASLEAILSISDGGIALGILVYFLFKPEEYLTKW